MTLHLHLGVLTAAMLLAASPEPVAEEYRVKGGFLLNFAKFVEWPPQAFQSPSGPLVICVLGRSPFGPAFEDAARDVVVAGRGMSVRQISEVQQASHCQIVFITTTERRNLRPLIEAVKGASVLTVGEMDGFIASGGIINLKLDGEKIHIQISAEAAARANLRISAKLMSLAQGGKR